jgi:Putative capsular polysaccharide synthesis protein/Sulfotransferase family
MPQSSDILNALQDLRFRLKMSTLNLDRCILVHQMGKVGSSTIIQSLEDLNLRTPVFHTHILNPQKLNQKITWKIEQSGGRLSEKEVLKHGHLKVSKYLVDTLQKESKNRHWKIITLVREPIGRNISAFFQNINTYYENFIEQYNEGLITRKEIEEKFFNECSHNWPLDWLDKEIKDVFGIDIYQESFPLSEGYKIYAKGNEFELMIIKMEDLNRCHKDAFRQFLGIENFSLSKKNIASDKIYSEIYNSFLSTLSIPNWYIEQMYSSKYSKHFYSDIEIEQNKTKWSGQIK